MSCRAVLLDHGPLHWNSSAWSTTWKVALSLWHYSYIDCSDYIITLLFRVQRLRWTPMAKTQPRQKAPGWGLIPTARCVETGRGNRRCRCICAAYGRWMYSRHRICAEDRPVDVIDQWMHRTGFGLFISTRRCTCTIYPVSTLYMAVCIERKCVSVHSLDRGPNMRIWAWLGDWLITTTQRGTQFYVDNLLFIWEN
jgi:hypothetical protein